MTVGDREEEGFGNYKGMVTSFISKRKKLRGWRGMERAWNGKKNWYLFGVDKK